MKSKILYNIATMALVMLGAAACADQNYTELDKGHNMHSVTASATDLLIHESNHAAEAIAIEWTTGENYGSGNAISYTLELAETATDFQNPVTVIDDSRQTYSWKPSTEDLNNILLNRFGLTPGEGISLDARVTARVAGME